MAAPAAPAAPAAGQPVPWSSGLADCCEDSGTCLLVCCVGPCINYGQNVDRVKGGGMFGPCLLYCCCPCLACIYAGQTRGEIRAKYGLQESPCSDCCVHCFCSPCAVCQETRELARKGAR